jgi:hypothetical protein
MIQRRLVLAPTIALLVAASCIRRHESSLLNPVCEELEQAPRVSCVEAVLVARAVARSDNVTTSSPKAEVKPEAVAKGESVRAWWVTFGSTVYHPPLGGSCALRSYAVIVDATTGDLLAWDKPSPNC